MPNEAAAKPLERLEKNGIRHDSVDEAIWVKMGADAVFTGACYTLAGLFD